MTQHAFSPAPSQAPEAAATRTPAGEQWRPVKRKPRSDGWTPERQRAFIAALAETGRVEHAARAVGISATSCYRLRRARGAESFTAAWDAALRCASERQLDAWRASDEAQSPVPGLVRPPH